MGQGCRLRPMRFPGARALALLLSVSMPHEVRAQWTELVAGTEASRYLHAAQLTGLWGGEATGLRPYGPAVIDRWKRDSVARHPWASRFNRRTRWISILRPQLQGTYARGDFPWIQDDGPVWQGLGATTTASAGIALRIGPLSARLEPVVFRSGNQPFPLLGDTARRPSPFLDALRPYGIDLPQRFGRGTYQRVDAGQSEIRLDLKGLAVGVSTGTRMWGPGLRHGMLLSEQAPGIPHLFLGTSRAWRSPLGRLSGLLFYGKGTPSGFQPPIDTADRLISGAIAIWRPPTSEAFEFGVGRLYHKFWTGSELSARTFTAPFGSFFTDRQTYAAGEADNQLLTVFARLRSPEDGFEVYGEFGRNDRGYDARDIVLEPDHNSAWLIGFAKASRVAQPTFWLVRGDLVNGRIGSISRLNRAQAFFYEHYPITTGHTQRGQLLGSPLLERTGGAELAVDRYMRSGRIGLLLTSRAMPTEAFEGELSSRVRTQWAVETSLLRFVGRSDVLLRGGYILDVNRWPGLNGRASYLSLSTRVGL